MNKRIISNNYNLIKLNNKINNKIDNNKIDNNNKIKNLSSRIGIIEGTIIISSGIIITIGSLFKI
jgi:uncharacterized membrane protein YkgB